LIAAALGPLRNRLAFIGGCATGMFDALAGVPLFDWDAQFHNMELTVPFYGIYI
jgi:hypothetical protein